jgi:hypothetical protein
MNHFLLAGDDQSPSHGVDATRYGVHLMELLINGLLKKGARRDRLEAKIFVAPKPWHCVRPPANRTPHSQRAFSTTRASRLLAQALEANSGASSNIGL